MQHQRRKFLKMTGASLASSAFLAASSGAASAAPDVEWIPADENNYMQTNRSAADIDWIVMHTIQGTYQEGINTFRDPAEGVSAHYVVGEDPDQLAKMVRVDDVAFTAGNWGYNEAGINIELEGYSGNGFPEQLYQNAAELVEYLCDTYGIPKRHPRDRIAPCDPGAGRGGIIGHDQIPDPDDCSSRGGAGGHTDPGPYFDWEKFVSMVGGGNDGGDGPSGTLEVGQRVKTTANLVIHTQPELSAPDVWTAPDGSAGYVRSGPRQAGGFTWWKVGFNAGHEGWCVEKYLTDATLNEDPSGKFRIEDRVDTTADLVVHTDPGLSAPRRWVAPEGSAGYVRKAPENADGYTWWNVEFNAGHQGWCAGKYLEEAPVEVGSGRDPLPFGVDTDLTKTIDVTGGEIDAAIAAKRPNSPLIGLGDTFVDVQQTYSINALYQAAHAAHESAWGTSNIARDHNNLYGWNAKDACPYECADGYDSFEECVWGVMEKINDLYLTPGTYHYNGPTLEGMNVKYATDEYEPSDPETWAEKIAATYNDIAEEL